jgi:hypothetical protein
MVAEWQVTATTVYCDAVDDDVTIMVHHDWSTSCTGYRKYVENLDKATAKLLKRKARQLGRDLRCEGPLDHRVTDYRDKLVAEEKADPVCRDRLDAQEHATSEESVTGGD